MLKLDQVSKVYSSHQQQVKAVDQVTLHVQAGEAVALQGPSGCGKTTMLLMSGALLRPTSGTISVQGTDPYSLSANQRSAFRARHIGFVFQQFHLIPYLNVVQNILTANVPAQRADARHRADELIRQFRLEDRTEHLPAELSVGEKQRVALARAVFNQPALVLADEPTGNLDPDNAQIVLDALRQYADDGAAVLIVTHDPSAAARAHRIVHLDKGRVMEEQPATDAK